MLVFDVWHSLQRQQIYRIKAKEKMQSAGAKVGKNFTYQACLCFGFASKEQEATKMEANRKKIREFIKETEKMQQFVMQRAQFFL